MSSSNPFPPAASSQQFQATAVTSIQLNPFVIPRAPNPHSIPDPTPTTMTALHQFGAEMLKLSRGLESVASSSTTGSPTKSEFSISNHLPFPSSPQRYATNQQLHQQQLHHQQQQLHMLHSHGGGGGGGANYLQQTSPKGKQGTANLGLSSTTFGLERESTRNSLASSRMGEQSDG